MATISAQQFFKGGPVKVIGNHSEQMAQQQSGPGFFSRLATGLGHYAQSVGSEYMSGTKSIIQNTVDGYAGKKDRFSTDLQNTGDFAKMVFAPITEAVTPIVNKAADVMSRPSTPDNQNLFYDFANSSSGDAVANTANSAVDAYTSWATKHPDAAKNLEASLNIGALLAGEKPLNATVDALGNSAKAGLDTAKTAISDTAKAISEKNPIKKPTLESITIKDATPTYSKKLIGESPTRVSEGGIVKGRTVNPTSLEVDAGKALTAVKDYPVKGTALEKYQTVQPEIARQSNALVKSLKNEKILRPPQQVLKVVSDAVKNVPEKSLLLQKSDPVISNYMRVIKNAISQNDGTLAGELKVRQAMDNAYENARGKLAFGSDKISALDDVHKAGRNALNQDIISHAQSTDVKASLKLQWDLIRASDVLRAKAEAEAGSTLGRFVQKHPVVSRAVKGAARAAGIGEAIHILP